MTIEKLPSGKYRITEMRNGKRHRITVDYKPTKREAQDLIREKCGTQSEGSRMLFLDACKEFYNIKSNVLSPSTIRGYKSCERALSDWFKLHNLEEITSEVVQKEINSYAKKHSAKSTHNLYGFISTILAMFSSQRHISISLPKKPLNEANIPTEDDVEKIYALAENTPYYIPLVLAGMGMRRSEILAATIDDLDGNILHIRRGKVQDSDGNWITKETPKTEVSARDIILPKKLVNLIRKQGYIYNKHPEYIWRFLRKAQDELGIEHFPLHNMRHFFASYAHNVLHLTDEQIMSAGGWKSDHILKSTYRHAMEKEKSKKKIADAFDKLM